MQNKSSGFSYLWAGTATDIADGVIMWATTIVIIATRGTFQRTTTPCKARATVVKDTAAGGALRASVVLITDIFRCDRGWWCWTRGRWCRAKVRWVQTVLYWVRSFHCNSTFTCLLFYISFHSYVPLFSPFCTPRVPNNPIILAIFGPVSNHNYTMVQIGSTWTSEDALIKFKKP